jgi:4-carboxymuconolactone decarboxylase
MARLPYLDLADAPERVREALEAVPPLNIFRTMAHAETAFRPWLRWGGVLLGELELDPALRELAILRVAQQTPHAEYEWVQHVPIAFAVGATQAQVDAIEQNELHADAFDDVQRNVLQFTDEVIHDARASEPTFEALRTELSPREVVELLMVIGQYMMLARVMATVDIELDEPAGRAVLDRTSREG